jgi:hypothetical protein
MFTTVSRIPISTRVCVLTLFDDFDILFKYGARQFPSGTQVLFKNLTFVRSGAVAHLKVGLHYSRGSNYLRLGCIIFLALTPLCGAMI